MERCMIFQILLVFRIHPCFKCGPVVIGPLVSICSPVLLMIPFILDPHLEQLPFVLGPLLWFFPHPAKQLPLGHHQIVEIFQATIVVPVEVCLCLKCKRGEC